MKSIFLVFVCTFALSSAQLDPSQMGQDFIVDNIVKPLLEDIQQGSLTFLQQLLQGMIPGIGKRDLSITPEQMQLIKEKISQHLSKRQMDPSQIGQDFIVDNIVKPLLEDIQQGSLTFLQQLLQGMIPGIGKRDADSNQIAQDFVVDNILKPLIDDISNGSLNFLQQQLINSIISGLNNIPGIGKRQLDPSQIGQDFVVDNILNQDQSITVELLREQIFNSSKMTEEESLALMDAYDKLLTVAAYNNWLSADVEKHLQQTNISEDHTAAFIRLWNGEHEKIHDVIVSNTVWNQQLSGINWRIDVQSSSRNTSELNQPTAIIEIRVNKQKGEGREVMQFEMDQETVNNVLKDIDAIEEIISSQTS